MRWLGLAVVFLCHATTSVLASMGDSLYSYRICLVNCQRSCDDVGYPSDLPWSLKVFGWTCEDECKYSCMHKVTAKDVEHERPIKQFHGKWPFIRFLGIQEPASTLFSVLNGLGHIAGWLEYRSVIPQDYTMYKLWKYYMLKLDYFCATSLVVSSIFCFFVRVVGPDSKWKCGVFGVIVLTMYCCHVVYLGFIDFDYDYNIKANVIIGIINIIGWTLWCLKNYYKQKYLWKCLVITISLFFFVGLEVFDFPPFWGTFDAHSLWHLSTVPCCYFWYRFLIDDAKYHLQEEKKKKRE